MLISARSLPCLLHQRASSGAACGEGRSGTWNVANENPSTRRSPDESPSGHRCTTYLLLGHRLRGRTRTSSPSGGCPLGSSLRRVPPSVPPSPPRKHASNSSPSASSVSSRLAAATTPSTRVGKRPSELGSSTVQWRPFRSARAWRPRVQGGAGLTLSLEVGGAGVTGGASACRRVRRATWGVRLRRGA